MRRLLVALGLALASAAPAWAAVAYDNASSAIDTAGASNTLTVSHTLNSVTNGAAVACAMSRTTAAPTSVTYNGAAMTQVGGTVTIDSLVTVTMWRILTAGMAAATHDLVIDWGATSTDHVGGIVSFTGVDQTTPVSGAATATDFSATAAVTVTSATGNMGVSCVVGKNRVVTSLDTSRWTQTGNDGYGESTIAGAASVVLDWTLTAADTWGIVGASVDQSGGTAAPVRHRVTQQ